MNEALAPAPASAPDPAPAAGDDRELRVSRQRLVNDAFFGGFAIHDLHDLRLVGGIFQFAVNAFEQHLYGRADDLQVAEFLGGDIHQHIVLIRVRHFGAECLGEILHGCGQLTVFAAELLQ